MSDKKILTFEDLVFQKHSTIGVPEVSASIKFKNGGWILVVFIPSAFRNASTSFVPNVPLESSISRSTSSFVHWYDFEVMSSLADEVLSYLTPDEVTEHMIGIQMRVL
jgi:hypothetical protein